MAIPNEDRAILEIREMLAKLHNKDAVVRVLQNRGMAPEEARDLVYDIHKAILSANRKYSLYGAIGSGAVCALLVLLMVASRRMNGAAVIFAVISGLGFLWSSVKFLTASGYEVEDD